MKPILTAKNLTKSYAKGILALNKVSFTLDQGKVLVVMGPSGSGKSTLIRTINGLETFDKGELNVLGIKIRADSDERKIQKIRRRVGMVFQQFNLFPHLSILENITLAPIQVQKRNKKEAEEYGMYLLCQMGIESHAKKYPGQLSGGEQQRVAIARSLALKPELLLFDEPTSALDPERINEVLDAMRRLAHQGMTMIVVTHEIKFAKEVSDQVLFIDSGKILEISSPEVFFSNASHERSRKFLNQIN
ncbi:amino acid ABC transporter ATP-binding protein, PAAT family [Prochlorococcus marinus str. MIT 9312]|uniref:Amino acid ABC transporter ATP-binding protein, PAAT family n=1 Tax=Prochlorococcus marinus (strain MIT 9312) TaxID=74546 RepID=Q31A71_PROM9|nr:amino acid ABC transporter ATP-binding protein [Prochlorococcus marinus]ABB50224.1 amino acid ABC transporter ATP-binding protein, PAAT family [Prochlorococcus marinus str. MIT 9312]KGG01618.1 ABC transporter for amino acid [Prochlorococcus marinus str. MIT 9311]